jgi:adenylate kinase
MGTEVAKRETTELSLDFGSLSLEGLSVEEQNKIRTLVAEKKFELALDVATRKVKLDSSKADMDTVINTARALDQTKAGYSIKSEHETASGKTTINVSKVRFNPFC